MLMSLKDGKGTLLARISLVLLYALLFFQRTRWEEGQIVFAGVNLLLQVALDLTALGLANRIRHRLLTVAFLAAAFTDLIYGISLQVMGITDFNGTLLEWVINLPYITFLVLGAWSLVTQTKQRALTSFGAAVAGILLLANIGREVLLKSWPAQTVGFHWACLIVEAFLLAFAIATFVQKKAGWKNIAAGFAMIASYGILLQCFEVYQELTTGLPVEVLWTLGLLEITIGLSRLRATHGN